ncbi:MAG: translocation/assembly module TamB domain-containing protein [Bacteroidales bacterium]
MRKFFKWFFRIILAYVILILLLSFALYIPFVQNFARDIVQKEVSKAMDMDVSVGKLRLYFPLKLQLSDALIIKQPADTLLRVSEVSTSVAILPLLMKEVKVNDIEVRNAIFHFIDSAQTIDISAKLRLAKISGNVVQLKNDEIDLGQATLSDGSIAIQMLKHVPDTAQVDTTNAFPWKFVSKRILLRNIQVQFADLPSRFSTNVNVESASLKKGSVDLLTQEVRADKIRISNGRYVIMLPDSASQQEIQQQNIITGDTIPSIPWDIQVGNAFVENNQFEMHVGKYLNDSNRFNMDHLFVKDININSDSLHNRGLYSALKVKSMSAKLTSDLVISNLKGYAVMDTNRISVNKLDLNTLLSSIQLTGTLAWGGDAKTFSIDDLSADLNANISTFEVQKLIEEDGAKDSLLNQRTFLTAKALLKGSKNRVNIQQFDVRYPECFDITSRGVLDNIMDYKHLTGNIVFDFIGHDAHKLLFLLPKKMSKQYTFPNNFQLKADLKAYGGVVEPNITLLTPKGKVKSDGKIHFPGESYDLTFKADSFYVTQFMPSLGVNCVDFSMSAQGRGWDFLSPKTEMDVRMKSNVINYDGHNYSDLELNSTLAGGKLKTTATMRDKDVNFTSDVNGTLAPNDIDLVLNLDVKNLNLQALNVWSTPFRTAFTWNTTFKTNLKEDMSASGDIYLKLLEFMDTAYSPSEIRYNVQNKDSLFRADITSGDMSLNILSPKSVFEGMKEFQSTMALLSKELKAKTLSLDKLKENFPTFDITLNAGKNNILNTYLAQDLSFIKSTRVKAAINPTEGLSLNAILEDVQSKQRIFDTIQLTANQDQNQIDFIGMLANRARNSQPAFQLKALGKVSDDSLVIRFLQHNQKGKTGLDIGCRLSIVDQALRVSLFPTHPVIGFTPWTLNENNYISISKDKEIKANLDLVGEAARIHAYSLDSTHAKGGIAVDVNGIDLQKVAQSIPYFSEMTGSLNSRFNIFTNQKELNAEGLFNLDKFILNGENIGDVQFTGSYLTNSSSQNEVDASMIMNNKKVLKVTGTLSDETNHGMNVKVDASRFPLRIANPFIPSDLASMKGYLDGELSLKEGAEGPVINGSVKLDSTYLMVVPANSQFRVDEQPVVIKNNFIRFDSYKLFSTNKTPLILDGSIDLRRLDYIYTDLSVTGNNFQLLDAAQTEESMVYGKAYINLNTTIRGLIDRLVIRGNMSVLNQTNLTYVMQESAIDTQNKTAQLVRFVNFADTTSVMYGNLKKINELDGIDLLFTASINPGVKLAMNLSTDGSSRVNLVGGGTLTYQMSREGTTSLTGQYVLTGGTVIYTLPIIGAKIFDIQDGSNVSWSGNLLNPIMNITAIEKIKATVSEDNNNSQLVTFNAIVRIQNSLENMSVTFDAAAPDNLSVQNRLASLPPEQRAKEAMNLILYNSVSLSGMTSKSASSSALNSFIESTLNQFTRNNLKGVNLSFGIDNYDPNEATGSRTDYTVQFSKSFLNDRFTVNIGGRVSTGADPSIKQDQNFIDDLSIDYMLDKNGNLYVKLFHHTGYDNILEGQITQTGAGVAIRRKLYKMKNLFNFGFKRKREKREQQKLEESLNQPVHTETKK